MLEIPKDSGIVGIDEAGVGPWAGPVVAAAVLLQPSFVPYLKDLGINDSKKLTAKKRKRIFSALEQLKNPEKGFDFSIGQASPEEIDTINIRQATHLAMSRALNGLTLPISAVLIDGNHGPKINTPMTCIIKGDQKILSISMASVIAKVHRDKIMLNLHKENPHYDWNTNAGYGTKSHQVALKEFGVTKHHRKSYAPIKALLA